MYLKAQSPADFFFCFFLRLAYLFSCKAVSEALKLLCRPVGILRGPFPPLGPGLKSYVAPVMADFLNVAH